MGLVMILSARNVTDGVTTQATLTMNNEHRFNLGTSLPGMIAAPVGTALLLVVAAHQVAPWKITSFGMSGGTLVIIYTISTLYHAQQGRARLVLREFDHYAIYLLIAGSYTPFAWSRCAKGGG